MFESFLNFDEVKNKPYMMLIWAVIISSLGIIVAMQISYRVLYESVVFNLSGIFAVLFTIIPAVYFITMLIKTEENLEEKDILTYNKKNFWQRHELYLQWMGLFFIGITLTFAVWSFILPQDFFQVQNSKIDQIQGNFVEGDYIRGDFGSFSLIVQNNLQVLLFAFIFSLIFGAGAIFIITWNASILGIAITRGSTYLYDIPLVGLRYLPHGIPEILAYICAGLAGGILSAAIIRKHDNRVLKPIMFDSAMILLLAIALIIIAGGIEVYL
jgi:uncharacterized membrane protein SpoIIM required for sporulation